jgi:uncharacterized membrane protein YgcG
LRKQPKRVLRPISTTRTRVTLMILLGLAASAAVIALLRYLMAVAYTELMRTNTGPSDWAVAPFLATIFALVLFPYRGVARLPRVAAFVVALLVAVATGVAVRATQPAVAASHITVLLALCALAVAVVLKVMWATITFRVPTQAQVMNGIASGAIEVALAAVFGAAGCVVGEAAGGSGDSFTSGGGSFGGGGSSGSW